jgi:hypothetical protein
VNSTTAILGNCAGAVCIDYPTRATPEFVKFSDKTDVIIYYHLSSTLYGDPAFAAGLRLRLDIFHESDLVNPAFNKAWDVDVLPSGFLTVHWSGFTNGNERPRPGKYTIALALVDGAGNVTSYEAVEPESIWIQMLNVQVAPATDEYLNAHGLPAGTDALEIAYTVTGLGPGDSAYDEIRFRITDPVIFAVAFEGSVHAPFSGHFSWDGRLGGTTFIGPGRYELVLEVRENGALLGTSAPHDFYVYKVDIDLAGMNEDNELTPGAILQEGKTKDVTVALVDEPTALPGSGRLKTDDEPGTLSAADGATSVDIDAGVDVPTSDLGSPKTFTLKAEPAAATGKTTISFSYQPPGTAAGKKAVARAAVTVVRARIRAVSSDPTKQLTDGVFVEGSRTPIPATPANLPALRYKMRPLKIDVGPDLSSATVVLEYESGGAANVELFEATPPYTAVPLPKTWTTADFASHKLDRTLLAYGKAFSEVVLKLSYVKGGATVAEDKLKLRVAPFPGLVGVAIPGQFPFFRVVRTVNEGSPVKTAVDPSLHKERVGKSAAVFVVAHKTAAEWAADPTLTDVTGSSDLITIAAGSIAGNVKTPWAGAASGKYDVVYDFGNFPEGGVPFATDNRLDPGDILDGAVGSVSVFVEPSFTSVGPAATSMSDYGMVAPITTTSIPAGYDGLLGGAFGFRLRGQVVHPTVLGASHPLVVIAHGNHTPRKVDMGGGFVTVDPDMTSDENFKGYTYLQEHLASRGFITLSVDLDEMVGTSTLGYRDISGSGIRLRGWIVLKNIEALLTDASIAGGALVGKIDSSRMYFVGHSRGGEAIHQAVHLLKTPADRPPGGTIAGFSAADVKGLVSLSPTTATVGGGLLPADVPFLLLYGSADGDVNGATSLGVMPFRHYDRATADRYAIRIEGGNHNHFNTSWGSSDASESLAFGGAPGDLTNLVKVALGTPVGGGLVSPIDQRDVAEAYIAAFLALVDGGDVGARDYFLEPPARLRPIGVDPALSLHGQARQKLGGSKFVLDDFETNPSTATSASGETVSMTAAGVSEEFLQDTDLFGEGDPFNRFFQETRGVLFSWSGPKSYVQNLAGAEKDLRGAAILSFRIAQQPKHAHTLALGGPMTLQVELEDSVGNKKAINLSVLDSVPGIYEAEVEGDETTSAAFKTFRLPLAAFATDGATLDMARVAKIRLKLAQPGDSAEGRVAIDDLEIEK